MQHKIIFLDIDGVLAIPRSGEFFDKNCCKNLKEILDVADAKIVVSSSWRECELSVKALLENLERNGIAGDYVIGKTPDLSDSVSYWHKGWDYKELRWREIERYIAENDIKSYVIIDDYNLTPYISKRFVKTNECSGLTARCKDLCIQILNDETDLT
ncbi:MAG: hypothetical protein LBC13_01725 [Clostridiales bacterium]|jgi:hypothetical protein|nr:hypothetical protein [Clostridiales bacterium]